MISSKVSTKSTSLRTDFRDASYFLAAQGPTKTTSHPGCFFVRRAVYTTGINAIEIYGVNSGYNFFAITDYAGQQDVAINGSFSSTD